MDGDPLGVSPVLDSFPPQRQPHDQYDQSAQALTARGVRVICAHTVRRSIAHRAARPRSHDRTAECNSRLMVFAGLLRESASRGVTDSKAAYHLRNDVLSTLGRFNFQISLEC